MAFCKSCKAAIGGGEAFCPACGSATHAAHPAPVLRAEDVRPSKASAYAVIGSWSYVGTFLLMALPLVGFVLTIVWACGGAHNLNRRNLARSQLLLLLINVIFAAILAALLLAYGYTLDSLAQFVNL